MEEGRHIGLFLRKAETSDISAICKLWLAMRQEIEPDADPNVEWFMHLLKIMMANSNFAALVAEVENRVVGFVEIQFILDHDKGIPFVFSRYWYVMPQYRHTEVAAQLYADITEVAKKFGAANYRFVSLEGQKEMWLKRDHKIIGYLMEKDL